MNDVLPKPFTKEGLLHMLEKHLAHLKQPSHSLDMVPPPSAGLHPGPGRTPMKEEESPAKSPATGSTWNSPGQVPGVSPVASSATDEYGQMAQQPPPNMYAVQNPMQQISPMTGGGQMAYNQPGLVPQQARQTSGQHRRQISDISGGEEAQGAAKRQQMYPPNIQQGMPGMRR
jgi:osomolarity two-component system response regulator SKN7